MHFARVIGKRPTAVAVIGIVVFGAGAVATTLAGARSATAAPLPIVSAYTGDGGHGDGLNRFVVQLAETSGAPSAAPSSSGGSNRLDLQLLAKARQALGPDGHLAADSTGDTVYVVGSRSLPVGVGASAPPPNVDAELANLQHQPGVQSAQRLRSGGVLLAATLDRAAVSRLPGVVSVAVSPSVPVSDAAAIPNDPYFSYDWQLHNTGTAYQQSATAGDDVDALDAWPVTTGAGVVIADLDTGMDTSHPDLAAALWTNPKESCGGADTDADGHVGDCHGWNFYRNNADLNNAGDDAHGTMTAGVMVAQLNNGIGVAGLAPSAKIMPLVVGAGENVDMNAAVQAIYYAVDHGADVINCSFGGAAPASSMTPLFDAVAYAQQHGVMIAVSAGNDSANRDTSPIYPANVSNPALITVGSTDANDNPSSFSAYGKNTVALYAPGSLVATTNNQGGYSVASGTSFSAPLVAATLALEKSADPTATVDQLRTRLLNSTTPVAALMPLSQSGGRLNAGAALGAGPGVLHYRFGGFAGALPDTAFNARVTVTGVAPAGPYELRLQLLTRYQGATWAVSQLPISVGNATVTTDDAGVVTVPVDGSQLGAGQTYEPGLTLPVGTYAMTAQIIANGTAIGRAAAAVFQIADPSSAGGSSGGASPTSSSTPAPAPAGTSSAAPPATSAPSGGSTPPSGGSTPPSGSSTPPSGGTPTASAAPTSSPTPVRLGDPGSGSGPGGAGSQPTTQPTAQPTANPSAQPTANPTAQPTAQPTGQPGAQPSSNPTAAPTSTPAAPTSTPAPTTAPGGGGTPQYPGTDQFQITGLAPTTVPTSGGMEVLTGKALPSKISILVGGVPASVVPGNSSTSATFLAPPMQPGSYDVAVYAMYGNTPTTLHNALTYKAAQQPGSSTPAPTSQPSQSGQPSATSSPGATSSPAPTTSPSPGGGSTPTATPTGPTPAGPTPTSSASPTPSVTSSPSAQTSSNPTSSSVITGPGGLRLVRVNVNVTWDPTACTAGDCAGTPL